ncbi:hypothetical protein, conserved, partial [Leishmania shawi]
MIHADSLAHPNAAGDVALTSPRAEARRSLRVSFAAQKLNNSRKTRANRTASQQYELSFISSDLHHGEPLQRLTMPRSPLYPASIIPLADRKRETPGSEDSSSDTEKDPITADIPDIHGNTSTTDDNFRKKTTQDAASGALLIYPKKIDNLRRFRILFAGVILSISGSTQGIHSVFGVLHLQQAYQFNARSMAIVYLSGVSVGLFTLPFGALYDWFGPRVVVALGSVIAALGHLLFVLTFGGHIPPQLLASLNHGLTSVVEDGARHDCLRQRRPDLDIHLHLLLEEVLIGV